MSWGRLRQILAGVMLVCSVSWFIDRSLLQKQGLWDFGIFYASSHAWLHGTDPYNGPELWNWWDRADVGPYIATTIHDLPPVAPPLTLVVLAPFAALSPPAAVIAWTAFCLALLALQAVALARLANLKLLSPLCALLITCVLLMSPMKMALIVGQTCVPAAACVVLGVWAASQGRSRAAGIFLAVATAFKIQLGLPFILIYLFIGRYRVGVWAAASTFLIAAIALLSLHWGGTNWFNSWEASLRLANTIGGLNDFGRANQYNYELLNLQLPVNYLISSRMLTNAVSVIVGGVLTATLLIHLWRHRAPSTPTLQSRTSHPNELLIAALTSQLLLLPVYHRYYDGILLTLTLAWVCREFHRQQPGTPRFVGLILFMTLFTPDSFFTRLATRLPPQIVRSTPYFVFIYSYRVWAIVLTTVALLRELIVGEKPLLVQAGRCIFAGGQRHLSRERPRGVERSLNISHA